MRSGMGPASIDLYWLPLGAGGWFVRMNGRIYERLVAVREHREPLDLYHTALQIRVPEGAYVIENAWPIPDRDPTARGVTVQGPVWHPRLGRLRVFRYEVRRWPHGTIADMAEAVESPRRVSEDDDQARQVLALTGRVPSNVWGRDDLRLGDMWNSNSVISWLLASAGIAALDIHPPDRGRAPGWLAGALLAQQARVPLDRIEEGPPWETSSLASRPQRHSPRRLSWTSRDERP